MNAVAAVDGLSLVPPPPRESLSYVERAAVLEETIARERATERRLARDSARRGSFHVNPYNRGDSKLQA